MIVHRIALILLSLALYPSTSSAQPVDLGEIVFNFGTDDYDPLESQQTQSTLSSARALHALLLGRKDVDVMLVMSDELDNRRGDKIVGHRLDRLKEDLNRGYPRTSGNNPAPATAFVSGLGRNKAKIELRPREKPADGCPWHLTLSGGPLPAGKTLSLPGGYESTVPVLGGMSLLFEPDPRAPYSAVFYQDANGRLSKQDRSYASQVGRYHLVVSQRQITERDVERAVGNRQIDLNPIDPTLDGAPICTIMVERRAG